jgi:NHL repeat
MLNKRKAPMTRRVLARLAGAEDRDPWRLHSGRDVERRPSLSSCVRGLVSTAVVLGAATTAITANALPAVASTPGMITTVAGDALGDSWCQGCLATSESLVTPPLSVTVDHVGNLVVGDWTDVDVVAENTGTYYGMAMTAGHIYRVAGNGAVGYSGDGGPATSAELDGTFGLAVDNVGNLVIADTYNNRIRVVAEDTGTFYGVAMTAGHIYTVAGNGTFGYTGDGGPATSAELAGPMGVASYGSYLLVSDTDNNRVRVIAGSTGTFFGIRMAEGDIYTLAGNGWSGNEGDGGPAASAGIDNPIGVAVDGADNVVVGDSETIRVIAGSTGPFYGRPMTAGDIYTVAGNGPATELGGSGGSYAVAVDDMDNVVLADAGNNRIRVVAGSTSAFYGVKMTAGDIYTVAGNGTAGYTGDGGPATSAELTFPMGVAVDNAGDLVVADSYNYVIRVVAGTPPPSGSDTGGEVGSAGGGSRPVGPQPPKLCIKYPC